MKFIKVTSISKRPIYININQIGHIESYTGHNDRVVNVIGVTTHSGQGFQVEESSEEILKLIEKA